ncbi:jg15195 [Pararge aegeria aegeria]|uniref:Jg15195 protein n=1 Tax=Pararge aegeria aegeria TaxID=348720 RepID=A0A8S4QQ36_9NEOP|nr:jg15195 [Pararge aegeria aegeria]
MRLGTENYVWQSILNLAGLLLFRYQGFKRKNKYFIFPFKTQSIRGLIIETPAAVLPGTSLSQLPQYIELTPTIPEAWMTGPPESPPQIDTPCPQGGSTNRKPYTFAFVSSLFVSMPFITCKGFFLGVALL